MAEITDFEDYNRQKLFSLFLSDNNLSEEYATFVGKEYFTSRYNKHFARVHYPSAAELKVFRVWEACRK